MKYLTILFLFFCVLTSCNTSNQETSTNNSIKTEVVQTGNDKSKLIPLSDKKVEQFAISLDSLLDVAMKAKQENNDELVKEIKSQIEALSTERENMSKSLDEKERQTFLGFTEKESIPSTIFNRFVRIINFFKALSCFAIWI